MVSVHPSSRQEVIADTSIATCFSLPASLLPRVRLDIERVLACLSDAMSGQVGLDLAGGCISVMGSEGGWGGLQLQPRPGEAGEAEVADMRSHHSQHRDTRTAVRLCGV